MKHDKKNITAMVTGMVIGAALAWMAGRSP